MNDWLFAAGLAVIAAGWSYPAARWVWTGKCRVGLTNAGVMLAGSGLMAAALGEWYDWFPFGVVLGMWLMVWRVSARRATRASHGR